MHGWRVCGHAAVSHMTHGVHQHLHTREERSEKRVAPYGGAWDGKERCAGELCMSRPWAMGSRKGRGLVCSHRRRKQAGGPCALALPQRACGFGNQTGVDGRGAQRERVER
jgi:hypothetical protein